MFKIDCQMNAPEQPPLKKQCNKVEANISSLSDNTSSHEQSTWDSLSPLLDDDDENLTPTQVVNHDDSDDDGITSNKWEALDDDIPATRM
jgi:hypothetical protein